MIECDCVNEKIRTIIFFIASTGHMYKNVLNCNRECGALGTCIPLEKTPFPGDQKKGSTYYAVCVRHQETNL